MIGYYHKNIKAVISKMLHFQKINNINSQCVTNCKFLYDFFRIKTEIKLNIVVGFVIRERGDGGFNSCTHVWIEYYNIYYEPSLEWVNSHRYITICDLLNSSIWKDIITHRCSDNEIRDGIRKLLIDWEMHSKQVNLLQFGFKGNEKQWEPAVFSEGGGAYYNNLQNFIFPNISEI